MNGDLFGLRGTRSRQRRSAGEKQKGQSLKLDQIVSPEKDESVYLERTAWSGTSTKSGLTFEKVTATNLSIFRATQGLPEHHSFQLTIS
jgi:hypothetical protein